MAHGGSTDQPAENIAIQTTTMFSTTIQTGVIENIVIVFHSVFKSAHPYLAPFENIAVTTFTSKLPNFQSFGRGVEAQQCFLTATSSCTGRRDCLWCRAVLSGCLLSVAVLASNSSSRTLDCRSQLRSTHSLTARASAKCSKDAAGADLTGSTPVRLTLIEIYICTSMSLRADPSGTSRKLHCNVFNWLIVI